MMSNRKIQSDMEKYKNQLNRVNQFKSSMSSLGIVIEVADEWELEGRYKLYLSKDTVAELYWNVPHYITFTSFVEQNEPSGYDDNIKDAKKWSEYFADIENSLAAYVRQKP